MAKLNEEVIIIKISEMLKDSEPIKPLLPPEMLANLEPVIGELTGRHGVMVEVARAVDTESEVQSNV